MVATETRVYRVKGIAGVETQMRILREAAGGFEVLITSRSELRTRTSEEYITRDLFDSCVRTGYLTEVVPGAIA